MRKPEGVILRVFLFVIIHSQFGWTNLNTKIVDTIRNNVYQNQIFILLNRLP